jgi:hypothetical protein
MAVSVAGMITVSFNAVSDEIHKTGSVCCDATTGRTFVSYQLSLTTVIVHTRMKPMDNANDTLRTEMNVRFQEVRADFREVDANFRNVNANFRNVDGNFREVNARIDALRIETYERIDQLRKEVNGRIDELRKETHDNFRLIEAKIDELRNRNDAQFRWLVGLMLTSMLGMAALLIKTI